MPRKTAPPQPDPVHFPWMRVLKIGSLVLTVLGVALGMYLLRQHVAHNLATPDHPPRIVWVNQPKWMTAHLAEQIRGTLRPLPTTSALDDALLRELHGRLSASPWINEVTSIRRQYANGPGDLIEIDCTFRIPAAVVRWGDYWWMVDPDGVRLPERYTQDQIERVCVNQHGQLVLRQIAGVKSPPPEIGVKWEGDDLHTALELVMLLHDKPYADGIIAIDATNHEGRVQLTAPHFVLRTRLDPPSRLYWGRPPSAADAFVEVSAETKLGYLQALKKQYGRVDANEPWLDLRFDRIQKPRDERADVE